jgi:NRPS condensation-like uncharacterized protein
MQKAGLKGAHLSPQQESLWHWVKEGSSPRVQGALELTGDLKPERLDRALRQTVKYHEILRTTFVQVAGVQMPLQAVGKSTQVACTLIDLEPLHPAAQRMCEEDQWQKLWHYSFDLQQGPMLYAELLRFSPQRHLLLLSLHALCADVATLNLLGIAILRAYEAAEQEEAEEQNEDPLQYVNVTAWLKELLEEEEEQEQEPFWHMRDLSQLKRGPLPFLRDEERGRSWREETEVVSGELRRMRISASAELQQMCRRLNVSMESLLLASWQILLWRLTNDQDFCIGVVCDGRPYQELAEAMGSYSRLVPVGISIAPHHSFVQIVQKMQKLYEQAVEHQLSFCWESTGE